MVGLTGIQIGTTANMIESYVQTEGLSMMKAIMNDLHLTGGTFLSTSGRSRNRLTVPKYCSERGY
jgi:hypothetical protein